MGRLMHASFNFAAPFLLPQLFQSLVKRWRVSPHIVERHAAININQISRVGQPAVDLMRRAFEIIHQHRPCNAVLPPVAFGVTHLLFEPMIGGNLSAGVSLADDDIYEVHLIAPGVVEFSERLDRACGNLSGERAEMKQDGTPAQLTQPQCAAADSG